MTPDERTELISRIKGSSSGKALLEYLADRSAQIKQKILSPVLPPQTYSGAPNPFSGIDPSDVAKMAEEKGAFRELALLEQILQADFEVIEERLAQEEVA